MERPDLERLSREQLIAEAERLEVPRPRVLTQAELVDEILGRTARPAERARVRGWLGRARDLLARVVERGLHLPEAARALRREDEKGWPAPPPPMPTVTLAEIYAAQGHVERALAVLDEVIAREPEHREARAMRAQLAEQAPRRSRPPREKEEPPVQTVPAEDVAPSKEASPSEASPAETSPAETSPAETSPTAAAPREAPAPIEAAPALEAPTAVAPVSAVAEEPATASKEPATPEEPALPERYEVDEVVAIVVDPRTVYLYWEVKPTTLARARARRADGRLCVRVATVIASWEGPLVDTRDLAVDALYGDRFVRDLRPGSNVRVSVGWLAGESFEPFAIGAELTAPRAAPVETVAQEIARWEAEPAVAPFQRRGPEPPPGGALTAAPAAGQPTRAHDVSGARQGGGGRRGAGLILGVAVPASGGRRAAFAPVDTGETIWGGHDADDDDDDDEGDVNGSELVGAWFEPAGSSDLGRPRRLERPTRERPKRDARRTFPGASELGR